MDGQVPESLVRAVEGRAEVELVVVKGVSPVGKARNEGLRRATGEYVAWVDADDEVAEDWLDEIVRATEAGSDLITFDAARVGWEPGVTDLVWGERRPSVGRLLRSVYQDLERMCSMWLFVSRRTLWNGLRFDEDAVICEDYLILPRLVARAKSLTYVPKKLYRYVRCGTSLVHRYGFTGEAQVMEMKRRRTAEAPRPCRSAAALGLAVAYYGIAIRVAHGFEAFSSETWRREARLARQFIRRNFVGVVCECLFRTRLPLRQKVGWMLRFAWCCLPARVGGLVRGRR